MRGRTLLLATLSLGLVGATAVAATGPDLARLNLTEAQLSADQSRNRERLARLLSVLEQLGREPPPALLVSPEDARDAVRAAILIKAMTPELQGRAQTYAAGAAEVMRQRRLAAVRSEALFEAESLAAEALPEPEAQPAPALRGPQAAVAVRAPASLALPASGRVVRRFGEALAGGGVANGLTLAAAPRARVTSPGDGIVQYVGPVKGWGVILILRLAGGYHLVLAGLERTEIHVGQSVAQGQPVGWTPDRRQSTSELYLEVREQGLPVDPARWLNKAAIKTPPGA